MITDSIMEERYILADGLVYSLLTSKTGKKKIVERYGGEELLRG